MQGTVVLYPSPGIGHVVSMVELGKLLSHKHGNNYSITILLTTGKMDKPTIDSYVHRISVSHPNISFRRFPHVSVDATRPQSMVATRFEFVRLNDTNVSTTLKEISETTTIRSVHQR